MFFYHRFVFLRADKRVYLHARRVWQEKRGRGCKGNVLYMKYGPLCLTKSCKQQGGILRSLSAAYQFHIAAGEVIVLNIYYNEGLHGVPHADEPLVQDCAECWRIDWTCTVR